MSETYRPEVHESLGQLELVRNQLAHMQRLVEQPGVRLHTDFGRLPQDPGNEWFLKTHLELQEPGELVELSSEPKNERQVLNISRLSIINTENPDELLFSLLHDEPAYKDPGNFNGKAPNFAMMLVAQDRWVTSVRVSAEEVCAFQIFAPEQYTLHT